MKASAYSNLYCLGIMTGTSCDGADLALIHCKIYSNGRIEETLLKAASFPMDSKLRNRLRIAQSGKITVTASALLSKDYSTWLALCVKKVLKKSLNKSTLISIHGQTIWHQPEAGISIQLLDPSIVSVLTGCSVAYQFRHADLARKGQGAPLVPLYHLIRAKEFFKTSDFPLSIHNIGGISNFTYLDPKKEVCFGFDTGPGNCLIDLSVERFTKGKQKIDFDGTVAGKNLNKIKIEKLKTLAKHPYFLKSPPKSTGRELFNDSYLKKFALNGEALIASTTAFTAYTMACAYRDFILKKGLPLKKIFFCGGGAENPVLLMLFEIYLNSFTKKKIEIGVLPKALAPSQFLEAMAFARFGVEGFLERKVALAKVTGAFADSSEISIFTGKNFNYLLNLTKNVR